MESSEDDAGTATNASRRESAREKTIAQIEDNNATASVHQGPSEARAPYQTSAMSEENYDSESVPSPSTQDLNTSTEAILDMIDEFVDGPKRLPSVSSEDPNVAPTTSTAPATAVEDHEQEFVKTPSPVTSAKSENISQENIVDIQMECASKYDVSIETNTEKHENSNSCSVSLEATATPVAPLEESALTGADVSSDCLIVNHPSSSASIEESVTNNLGVSQSQERTVKCVTSSDNQDKVTIENAESTSAINDGSSSVSVVPTVSAPGLTRSPLRRRLIRPAPSDRKPDTTVSSTVDSQVFGLHMEQTVSESIAKDVSSSSDAVLSTHDNVIKDYENRSVSEISVCKAETSVSSPKKIKINRQRLTPSTSHLPELLPQRQCQPTSSNSAVSASIESDCHSSSHISTSEPSVTLSGISSESSIHNDSPVQVSESNNDCNDELQGECQESNLSSNIMTENDNKDISLNVPSGSEIPSDERNISNTEQISEIDAAKESVQEDTDSTKQVPKLTIKLGVKPSEELKSPIPKLTIKPIKPPTGETSESKVEDLDKIPNVTKINIKPILKPPEKINDTHRKSSSSEISESEYSENDESTSDQASTSDHGLSNIVPKVTIKLGKPGTECEGKLYTEQKVPKLTIKGLHCIENENVESASTLKLIKNEEKIPKLTIKNVMKSESQPPSPKLTIKPIKPPENEIKQCDNQHIPKIKISPDTLSLSGDIKENTHVPKITIKAVTKSDTELTIKTPKKNSNDDSEIIPVVTKLNIKPVLKPMCASESNVELVSEVIKFNSNVDEIPKITKLTIKPLRNPEGNISKEKDCDEMNDNKEKNLPVVTKLNIKPIVKPPEEDNKDSDNQSSETGSSSDDNVESIPAVTKLNIKPIVKPSELEELTQSKSSNEESIPVVTKLNIKPVLKPVDATSPKSPKKDPNLKAMDTKLSEIPVVTKLNIKPILKPAESQLQQEKTKETGDMKNPPLVMKINMKAVTDTSLLVEDMPSNSLDNKDHVYNNVDENLPVVSKMTIKPVVELQNDTHQDTEKPLHNDIVNCKSNSNEEQVRKDVLSELTGTDITIQDVSRIDSENQFCKDYTSGTKGSQVSSDDSPSAQGLPVNEEPTVDVSRKSSLSPISRKDTKHTTEPPSKLNQMHEEIATNKISDLKNSDLNKQEISAIQNCTLLKQLLVSNKDISDKKHDRNVNTILSHKDKCMDSEIPNRFGIGEIIDLNFSPLSTKTHPLQELIKGTNENVTKPLEINTSEKLINQDSGQDSPRIILKINKTEQGPLAKIITDDMKSDTDPQHVSPTNLSEINDKVNLKKGVINSRRKPSTDASSNIPMGKRLRSSRVVQDVEKSAVIRRNSNKRPLTTEISPTQVKEPDITILETKRIKLGQLLSNKSLTITPILTTSTKSTNTSPPRKVVSEIKQGLKASNHSLLNNENCSKNGNSKLHSIISNLQANRLQEMSFNLINHSELKQPIVTELDSNTSTGSSDVTGSTSRELENCHPEVQEMIIQENSESREFNVPEEISQDPLEVTPKSLSDTSNSPNIPLGTNLLELTPQPKKRGRPRKLPVSEGAKPIITLPTTALEERPQRSLRLSRDRPAILAKPRGRGRGRGAKRGTVAAPAEVIVVTDTEEAECKPGEIDPTSSRVKLPRMTEALDKMPSACSITPLSSRRRLSHSSNELKLFPDTPELKVVLENTPTIGLAFVKSPDDESVDSRGSRGGRGRGSRGGRGRGTPRGTRSRGRGRGGGRGAIYMKETMGIYGRVCGPSTTTVQLFEEETCMMDDNATPSKPSHLLDEDSQSSVKSSTNESSKTKKSKFADLFDSSKWTAAEVKEYSWPPSDKPTSDQQVMMIQEQVAMFLGVKSFKRRYPELKRRTVIGEEKDYVLSKGVVTEALCDLGITAVDASDVLDIMLSDYPHKYEEYRSHQRQRMRNETSTDETTTAEKAEEGSLEKVEMKLETKVELKPEPPKVDPEKTKQDLALAAMASASEWNTRMNVARRRACADLQSLSVLCCAPPAPTNPAPPPTHVRPPAGFYPHALLPGQYQHTYRRYPADQLRYFPLNTVMATPAMADSSSESEAEWGSYSDSHDSDLDRPTHAAKRKKLTKQKRSSVAEASGSVVAKEEPPAETSEVCRECKLREEGNRKYSYERFLSCAKCDAKLHPGCVELSADTVRKCREYAWQCAECKTCCACNDAHAENMLFCDLCDRGFHAQCVGLPKVPSGRWHCVECAICKSCGARDPGGLGTGDLGGTPGGGPPEWHHQTRRGPGGHKLYSHSLCTPCARAYRIGRYCPLCERSFIGPKGTMQLVICKLCDRQLHQECVRQTVSSLNVLDYTCGECRRGGITSRAAAVRLAPRTIATLFMAKRRFNKYAHRQYMQSRLAERAEPKADVAEVSCGSDGPADAEGSDPLEINDPLDAE